MKNFKNMFLALSLIFVASATANTAPEVVQQVTENVQKVAETLAQTPASVEAQACDCVVFNAITGTAKYVWENKGTFAVAAVVVGAVVYYVSTLDDADTDNI